jgi:hypothetical protein
MQGDTRGTDLNSWWRNRALRRQEINQLVAQLRDTQSRLTQAAGNARPSPSGVSTSETPAKVLSEADPILTGLQSVDIQIEQLSSGRAAEQNALESVRAGVQRAAEQRSRHAAEAAARQAYESAQQWQKQQQTLRKLCAVGIFLAVLFVLARF